MPAPTISYTQSGVRVAISPSMSRRPSAMEWRCHSRRMRRCVAGSAGQPSRARTSARAVSELRDAREGPAIDPECRHDGCAEEALDDLARRADRADAGQGVEVGLGEAQVLDRTNDLPALDQERPVPGHACDHRELRVDAVR